MAEFSRVLVPGVRYALTLPKRSPSPRIAKLDRSERIPLGEVDSTERQVGI